MANYQELANLVWNVADDVLRGLFKQHEYGDITLPFLVLRRREVKPHVPDSWIDRQKDKVGYEINFNRYFYQYTPLRSLKEITDELLALERKSEGLLHEVLDLL